MRPLHEPAELQEMPAVVAVHIALGDTEKGAHRILGAAVEIARPVPPDIRNAEVAQVEKGEVQAGPQILVDHIAHLAGVFARVGEAAADRIGIAGIEGQVVGQGEGVDQHEPPPRPDSS